MQSLNIYCVDDVSLKGQLQMFPIKILCFLKLLKIEKCVHFENKISGK